uniref:Uncharacterized protein n=1 Tax=Panagrolaimus davidi TaxID=227884 RepID=A0A914QZ89_9BILA
MNKNIVVCSFAFICFVFVTINAIALPNKFTINSSQNTTKAGVKPFPIPNVTDLTAINIVKSKEFTQKIQLNNKKASEKVLCKHLSSELSLEFADDEGDGDVIDSSKEGSGVIL